MNLLVLRARKDSHHFSPQTKRKHERTSYKWIFNSPTQHEDLHAASTEPQTKISHKQNTYTSVHIAFLGHIHMLYLSLPIWYVRRSIVGHINEVYTTTASRCNGYVSNTLPV